MDEERLVGLLYTLMRDDVVPGRMEFLVQDAEKHGPPYEFCNSHLEAYARELAQRVLSDKTDAGQPPAVQLAREVDREVIWFRGALRT